MKHAIRAALPNKRPNPAITIPKITNVGNSPFSTNSAGDSGPLISNKNK